MVLPVDIIFDGQQVVGHGLEGELVQKRRHSIKSSVQNDQLRLGLFRTLAHGRFVSLVGVQLELDHLGKFGITFVVTIRNNQD